MTDLLTDVLGVPVMGQHAWMLIVGVVLHVAVVYLVMPSSSPGVAVGPDMLLVPGVYHVVGPEHLPVILRAGLCVRWRLVRVHGVGL